MSSEIHIFIERGVVLKNNTINLTKDINYHCNFNKEDLLSEAYVVTHKLTLLKTV
jgi:hypothetical protein